MQWTSPDPFPIPRHSLPPFNSPHSSTNELCFSSINDLLRFPNIFERSRTALCELHGDLCDLVVRESGLTEDEEIAIDELSDIFRCREAGLEPGNFILRVYDQRTVPCSMASARGGLRGVDGRGAR